MKHRIKIVEIDTENGVFITDKGDEFPILFDMDEISVEMFQVLFDDSLNIILKLIGDDE